MLVHLSTIAGHILFSIPFRGISLPASVGPHASVMPRQNIWPIWPRLVGEVPQDITLENVLAGLQRCNERRAIAFVVHVV